MLANQPEIITKKSQPRTVVTEDVYGAADAGQAVNEGMNVLSHLSSLQQAPTETRLLSPLST